NSPIVPKQTAYARVLSGELPILVDYDFNAYRARYKDKANVAFVIPQEGSISVPYVMSIVDNAPHRANAEKVLDFTLSDQGQALWAKAYLRPVRDVKIPADVAAQFLPDNDYARAGVVNYEHMAAVQEAFAARYLSEVK
ncbi:MAG: ABC transporter substrate-binding protein, partial [Pseudomonas sp.]